MRRHLIWAFLSRATLQITWNHFHLPIVGVERPRLNRAARRILGVGYRWKEVPGIFLLVAVGHLARIVFGTPVEVQGISIPVWASVVALAVTGFLSYAGFHLARKLPPKG